jgi:hypothetical protein
MSRPIENLSINPLFFDALSGEFRPMGDPKQTHTLGRLAVATFQKGELVMPRTQTPSGPTIYVLGYRPVWAPDVEANLSVYELDDFPHMASLHLNVQTPENDGLSCIKSPFGSPPLYLRLDRRNASAPEDSTIWPLELGTPLDEARTAVTEAAQELFTP